MHDRILSMDCLASPHAYTTAMREASAAHVSPRGIYRYIAHEQYWGIDEAKRRVTEANFAAVALRDGAQAWLNCGGSRKMAHIADRWVTGDLKMFVCNCGVALPRIAHTAEPQLRCRSACSSLTPDSRTNARVWYHSCIF